MPRRRVRIRGDGASVLERDGHPAVAIDGGEGGAQIHRDRFIIVGGGVHRGEALAFDPPRASPVGVADDAGAVGVHHEPAQARRRVVDHHGEITPGGDDGAGVGVGDVRGGDRVDPRRVWDDEDVRRKLEVAVVVEKGFAGFLVPQRRRRHVPFFPLLGRKLGRTRLLVRDDVALLVLEGFDLRKLETDAGLAHVRVRLAPAGAREVGADPLAATRDLVHRTRPLAESAVGEHDGDLAVGHVPHHASVGENGAGRLVRVKLDGAARPRGRRLPARARGRGVNLGLLLRHRPLRRHLNAQSGRGEVLERDGRRRGRGRRGRFRVHGVTLRVDDGVAVFVEEGLAGLLLRPVRSLIRRRLIRRRLRAPAGAARARA